MEDPTRLLRRLNLSREEHSQRLLTMLVLGSDYPRWNTESTPSERGLEFLRRLHELSFGDGALEDDVVFVDELELPRRHVQAWLWNARTSGGRPLTRAGEELGFELRFSRSRAANPETEGVER